MAKDTMHWLVKSGGRILGPLTTDEIERALRSKEIVPLDEIAPPFGRWHYIRDERAFDGIVLELRKQKGSFEITQTNTETDVLTDVTERISAFGPAEKLAAGISEQLNEKNNERAAKESSYRYVEPTTYAYSDDKNFEKVKRNNMFLWLALILVVGGISWKVVTVKSVHEGPVKGFDAILRDAKFEESLGNYGDALQLYKQAAELNGSNPEVLLGYGFRLLKIGQTVEAKQQFERIISSSQDAIFKSQAYLGLGLAALHMDNYAGAKAEAQKGLELNPSSGFLRVIQGVVSINESKSKEAANEYKAALERNIVHQIVGLLLAEAEYLSARDNLSADGYKNALEVLDSLIALNSAYTQEALALKLHVLIESKQVSDLERVATELLDVDPRLTEDHYEDPRLPTDRVGWEQLGRYLKRSLADVPSTPRLSAVLGYAMFRGREKLEGKKVIEDALAKSPDDKLIRAVLSYVQFLVGREEEALAGLTLAGESKDIKLPIILKGRNCRERKDYECSEEKWKELLEKDQKSLPAFGGLAWTYIDKDQAKEAERIVDKGLGLSPTYTPLLKARAALKKK